MQPGFIIVSRLLEGLVIMMELQLTQYEQARRDPFSQLAGYQGKSNA